MNRPVLAGRGLLTALAAAAISVGSTQAQAPNSGGYPYWGTTPQNYPGSRIRVPVPGMSPNTISNASRSQPTVPGMSGIGGAYAPPSITSLDLRLPRMPKADNKAHIWLRLPENAELWVNGVKTQHTGEIRHYFSPGLTPGKKFAYQMRIRWTKDGKPVEETQRIIVQAGETIRRDFTWSTPSRAHSEAK